MKKLQLYWWVLFGMLAPNAIVYAQTGTCSTPHEIVLDASGSAYYDSYNYNTGNLFATQHCSGDPSPVQDYVYRFTAPEEGVLKVSMYLPVLRPSQSVNEVMVIKTNCSASNSGLVDCLPFYGLRHYPMSAGTTYYLIVQGGTIPLEHWIYVEFLTPSEDGCYDPFIITDNLCTTDADPVCGCDGQTYPNDCYATEAGVVSTLSGTCPAMMDSYAAPIPCGASISDPFFGNTSNSSLNLFSSYGCQPDWLMTGPEDVYKLETSGGDFYAYVGTDGQDLDIFLLRVSGFGLEDLECVASGNQVINTTIDEGTYYLVVDGYQGASGNYVLYVDCPEGSSCTVDAQEILCQPWVQNYLNANYTCNDDVCGSINLYTSPTGECVVDFVGEQACLLTVCQSHEVFDLDGNLLESYASACGLEGLGYTGWQQVWSCGQALPSCNDNVSYTLYPELPQTSVCTGESVCIPITVENFSSITGSSIGLEWNPNVLSFATVENINAEVTGLDINDFDLSNISSGILNIVWESVPCNQAGSGTGITLDDCASNCRPTLFEVCFTVVGGDGQSTSFDLLPNSHTYRDGIGCIEIPIGIQEGVLEACGEGTTCPVDAQEILCLDWLQQSPLGEEGVSYNEQEEIIILINLAAGGGFWYSFFDCSGQLLHECASSNINDPSVNCDVYYNSVVQNAIELLGPFEPFPDCTGTGNDCFQVSATIVQPSCPDQNDGVITTTIFGGTPPYTYQWSTGADTPNLTGLSPGSYTLTVTDATGCARSIFVDISQKGGDAIALPDGTGASYESTIAFSQFPQGAMVQHASDIVYTRLDLEHSYSGDLDIELVCPDGASVHLLDYPSGTGSANLGEPFASGAVDAVSSDLTQGIPYAYTFVNSASLGTIPQFVADAPTYTYTTVVSEQTGQSYSYTDTYIPSGEYEPVESYASLVGCPLNGDWTIRVTDNLSQDNGWLFGWSLGLATGQQTASITLNDIPCNDGAYFLEASTYSVEPGEAVLLSYGVNPLGNNNVLHFGNGQSTPLQNTEGAVEVVFDHPGVYRPYIRIDGQTVAQIAIQVRSCGWFGFVRSNNNYRETNEDLCDLVSGDGRMYLPPALSEQFYYWTNYENIRDFPVQGDAATLEARIKVPQNEGGISCYDPQITIHGTEGRATARWMQPNCSYYSGIGAGNTYLAGSSTDLESLTADFSDWRILKIELGGQTISAFIDDELRYQVAYEGEVGNVIGLSFTAKGSSSLDWIRLYQGQSGLVYEENFDGCGLNDDESCNSSPWNPQACASGNTHFINVIYEELQSEIGGQPLQEGDWLGLFYEQDDGTLVCMDQAQFADPAQENGFLLRGCAESSPSADDGFAPDEPFLFKVFKDGVEYSSSALSVAFWAEGGIIPPIFPDATSRFIGDGRQSAIRSIRDFPDIEDPSCDTPIPISCGQSHSGNNTDGTDNALSYNCFTNVVDGPEVIYAFTLDQTSDVLITLGGLSDDLELLLLDECDRDHCIAVSERTGASAETILQEDLAPGEYIIVVEGYIGFESGYTLSLDCGDFQQGGFSCPPEEISCNETINSATVGGCSDVNFYNCSDSYTPGREKVYRIRFDQPENVRITLTPQGGDLELFLLDALDPDRCIYYSTESGEEVERILLDDSEIIPNRDYYIVVDEYGGDEGIGFQLQVDCIPDGPPCPWCPPPPGFCDNATEIACGSTVSGHTENGVSRVEKWGDCPSFNVGPELIYVFNNPVAQDVQINLSGFSENLNFYVLRDQCAVSACYEGWAGNKSGLIAESILITPMPAGQYYIVVDSYDAPSAFDLEIKCQEADNCFQLQVPVGYSYISSNRRPGDPTIENVLPTGQFQGMSLLLLDEWGNVYDPNFPTPNAPNKISTWDVTHGYRIDVTEEVALEFCGEEADPQAIRDVYVLNQGGAFHNNIIAYPFQEPMPVADAFAGAPSDVLSTIEYIYPNQAFPSETYNLQFQFGINFNMEPGVGYRLKVAEDGGFSYRNQDEPNRFVSNGCTYFQTPLRNTMERAFIRVPQQAVSALMQPGDELGLFNEAGLLCGSGKYLGAQLIIVLLGDDPATTSQEGFAAGEWMYAQTWSAATGGTQHVALQFSGSEPIYAPNYQYWLEGLSNTSGTKAGASFNWHLYPNPAGKHLFVECQLPSAQRVAVRLIGVDGQVLSQQEWFWDEGLNQRLISLAQLPDGVYFVQMAGEGFTEARKIVVQH